MILDQIIIPGQVISKKNSMKIIKRGKFPSLRSSDRYQEYEEDAKIFLSGRKSLVVEYPVFMHFQFVMSTNAAFDFNNLSQGPQDILTQMGIIPDDNYRYCIPVFFGKYAGVFKDKDNPRVTITFTDVEEMRKPEFLDGEELILEGYRKLAEKAEKASRKRK